jgi:hypothetical protein
MAASHPEMFRPSTVDESPLLKLVENHLLLSHAVLLWRSAKDEDILTPSTNKIVVLTSFLQRGFGLSACEFLRGLHHYKVELVHLNPNSDSSDCHVCPSVRGLSCHPPKFLTLQALLFLEIPT